MEIEEYNKKQRVRKRLQWWFTIMSNKYHDVTFKFEYCEKRGIYLVSYNPTLNSAREKSDFYTEVLNFEDSLDKEFKDYAPLFTENETVFTLSENAETFTCETPNNNYDSLEGNKKEIASYFKFLLNCAKSQSEYVGDRAYDSLNEIIFRDENGYCDIVCKKFNDFSFVCDCRESKKSNVIRFLQDFIYYLDGECEYTPFHKWKEQASKYGLIY